MEGAWVKEFLISICGFEYIFRKYVCSKKVPVVKLLLKQWVEYCFVSYPFIQG